METLRLAALATLLLLVGASYLTLLGLAVMAWLLPRRWLPFAPLVAPLLGWAVLAAIAYPLNCALPFAWVAPLLGAAAAGLVFFQYARRPAASRQFWAQGRLWREAAWPLTCAVATYALAMATPIRAGTLSAVVVDSDVEHFADVVAAMIHFPIGWSVAAQQGLEATPVGLAYHYVHASLSALTGMDTFTTAQPSHALMLALAALSVYLFARSTLGLERGAAAFAVGLFALGGTLPLVAAFGWGQQTAAVATVPFGLAALDLALASGGRRSLVLSGLAGAMAAGSLYLATAPLVGGCALAMAAAGIARRPAASAKIVTRLSAIGVVVIAAALLSHASAAAYLLDRLHAGLLRTDDMAGRSTHVATFVSLPTALGVTPLDLVRTVTDQRERTVLTWHLPAQEWIGRAAGVAGATLAAAGIGRLVRARRWRVLSIVAMAGAFEVYLRVLRPFPYGEFKLLTSVWFLAPCLVALGASQSPMFEVRSRTSRVRRCEAAARQGPELALQGCRMWDRQWLNSTVRFAAVGAAGLFTVGTLLNRAHTQRFLALPFGAALPDSEMAAARAVASAVPRGGSVYVSGQLTSAAAFAEPPLVTASRAGFTSQAIHADYLSRRWRGVVTSLLAFSGRPVYGLVTRHSTELRQPVAPNAADFLVLDEAEDPRLDGVLPADLLRAAGRLRLYRNPHRPALLLDSLAAASAPLPNQALFAMFDGRALSLDGLAARPATSSTQATLPAPVLPIGDSMPGRFHVAPTIAPVRRSASAPVEANGHLVVGLQAVRPTYVRFETREAQDHRQVRITAVEPGLTWYTSPPVRWPATLSVDELTGDSPQSSAGPGSGANVRPLALLISTDPAPAESLERSPAGTQWPLLSTIARDDGAGGVQIDAWYSYAGPREGPYRALLRDSSRLWDSGDGLPIALHPGPGNRTWTADLRPGLVTAQRASDGRQPPRQPPPWNPTGGARWLWLEFGPDHDAALHSVPVAEMEVRESTVRLGTAQAQVVALPLLADWSPPPVVADGTLVHGGSDAVYYVDHGRLRWVPSPEALQRLGIPWRLTPLSAVDLQRLPIGLPLG